MPAEFVPCLQSDTAVGSSFVSSETAVPGTMSATLLYGYDFIRTVDGGIGRAFGMNLSVLW